MSITKTRDHERNTRIAFSCFRAFVIHHRLAFAIALVLAQTAFVHAGLYCSMETYADLPAQWRGFLLDQRSLRQIAVPESSASPATPLRLRYLDERRRLDAKQSPTADDIADLGAILIRLGDIDRAIDVLRRGEREHPDHFAIAANLGTAWQLKGNLPAAVESLRQAVRLAPEKHRGAERLHLKLVESRRQANAARPGLDPLFDVRYFTPASDAMPDAERKKLTPRDVALAQRLALSLPADGSLLWQLAEMAASFGDVRTAASMMEGCTSQFNMDHPDLRRRRLLMKEASEKLPAATIGDKTAHAPGHAGTLAFRSRRPLVPASIDAALPPIRNVGVNPVPWEALGSTVYEGKFPPKFSDYVKKLDGKTVALTGFLQPLNEDASAYLFIESPVGCWYCDMPDLTGMVLLDAPGDSIPFQRGVQRIVGRLSLNDDDPESFLFVLRDAKLSPLD